MKKLMMIFFSALILYPRVSYADLDLLSLIQDEIASIQEKVNMVVKGYINVEAKLQELSSARNAIENLRDKYKNEYLAKFEKYANKIKQYTGEGGAKQAIGEFLSSRNVSLTFSGVKSKADTGTFASPEMKKAVAQKYIKRQHVNEDVETTHKIDNLNEIMARSNMSSLYANSLVKRVELNEEQKDIEKDETSDSEDVGVVKQKYSRKSLQATGRWVNMMSALSMYQQQMNTGEVTQGRVDDISDVTGEEEDPELNNVLDDANTQTTSINVSDLYRKGKQAYESIKNKDFGSALNTGIGMLGDVEQSGPSQEDYLREAGFLD